MNIKFIISYLGTRYCGFQIQPNVPTIEGALRQAFHASLKENVDIIGCSRTDTGVHAERYCFNTHLPQDMRIPADALRKMLNDRLPEDIAVREAVAVPEDFHARYDAKAKQYRYVINQSICRDVFSPSLHYPHSLDIDLMNQAAALLIGEHDFAAFCTAQAKQILHSTVRRVIGISVTKDGERAIIRVKGTGFLHNMVRIIAGTLVYVSEGKISLEDIDRALQSGDRSSAGKTLPPQGLYLEEVFYE
jgi:tRNA pseudouridine38-40 synthase